MLPESELKALVSLLDDEDTSIVSHIEEKILSLGTSVIPYLEQEWESNFNPHVQRRIEELIHTLQYELLKERLQKWYESDDQDLLTGMWLVATYQYPDIELIKLKQELEQIYYETWLEFKPDLYPYDEIKVINSVLFNKLKFGANTKKLSLSRKFDAEHRTGKPQRKSNHVVCDLHDGGTKTKAPRSRRESSKSFRAHLQR